MSLTAAFGPDGQVRTMDGLMEDIGERKQAEKAFRSGAERFRLLFEDSSVGMALAGPDGRLARGNAAFATFLGRSLDELRGSSLFDLLHPEEREAMAIRLAERAPVPKGAPARGDRDLRYVRPDGTVAWGHTSCFWLTEDEVAHSLVLLVQDVTARKRMEEDAARLEKLRSVGMLAGGLAHDFNNILAVILGNVSLASSHCNCAEEVGRYLSAALGACERARLLTQQLLTFARGGSPVRRPVSLVKIAQEAAYFSTQESGVTVDFQAEEDLPQADVDAGQIGQVFQHLFLNARDAMGGEGVVRVRMRGVSGADASHAELPEGRYIEAEVRDEGHGIPQENIQRVFDPYFTTRRSGTGLGLATVHSIIRRHGGTIEVESPPGQGATFRFLVPACAPSPPEEEVSTGPILRAAHRARVLVMDDTTPVREVLERVLERAGFDVVATRDGAEAATAYEEALRSGLPFAAVVLDLIVDGGVGGVEALRRMRAVSPDVRALVCSGYSADPVMANHREYGFMGVVPKPFNPSHLVKELLRIMKD